MAWRHLVTNSRIWRDIKTSFAWTDWGTDIGENFMVEKQSKKFIVHFCFHFKALSPYIPCLFMITEVSIRRQKNPEVGIRRIPAYTPQYTTGCTWSQYRTVGVPNVGSCRIRGRADAPWRLCSIGLLDSLHYEQRSPSRISQEKNFGILKRKIFYIARNTLWVPRCLYSCPLGRTLTVLSWSPLIRSLLLSGYMPSSQTSLLLGKEAWNAR